MQNRIKRQNKKSRARRFLSFVTNLLIMMTAALFLVYYVGYPVRQEGFSMEPEIGQQSVVLINRLCYRIREPQRFDVIAYSLEGEERLQIKRIVGLPGETIEIRDGKVYADGEMLKLPCETASVDIAGRAAEPVLLGRDEYFVLGDNPARSQDSRFESTGNIRREQITGRAWFYVGSLTECGFVPGGRVYCEE